LNMAGYALKNAAFIGGYLLDLTRIPAEWWPHNRVALKLRPNHGGLVRGLAPPAAAPLRVPAVAGQVAQAVGRLRTAQLCRAAAGWQEAGDELAAEEPLQLLLDGAPLSIVMRTPGNDVELALGLLWAEGVLRERGGLLGVRISAEAGERDEALALRADLVESN